MKNLLRNIFLDLSNKKLTEAEALEKIRAIKATQRPTAESTLYASPTWKIVENIRDDQAKIAAQHVILIHATSDLQKQLSKQLSESTIHNVTANLTSVAANFTNMALSCFEIIKNILENKLKGTTYVQIVLGTSVEEKLYEGLAALLKTTTLENHNLVGQLIISDQKTAVEKLAKELQAETAQVTDAVIKYEADKRYVKRLEEVQQQASENTIYKENGVYLITGGFGGIGIAFAKEILQQLEKTAVILAGRSKLTSEKKKILTQLSTKNKTLQYIQMDVTNAQNVVESIESIVKNHKKLHGIIHAAGINKDNFILKKSVAEFQEVVQAKIAGTYNIDEATKAIDLDFITYFSSIAAWFGNPGQADYAVGNAFMDEFAKYRNQLVASGKRKGKTLSVNWPLWENGGMEIDQEIKSRLLEETGFIPLDDQTGTSIFQQAINTNYSQILSVKGALDTIKNTVFSQTEKLQKEEIQITETISEEELFSKTTAFVRDEFSKIIKLPAREIETHVALEKYGIDSILAMNLTGQLEKTFGRLSKTLLFEYQTIDELSAYLTNNFAAKLTAKFLPNTAKQTVSNATKKTSPNKSKHRKTVRKKLKTQPTQQFNTVEIPKNTNQNDPIAIVGLSGRYPASENIQEFWNNLQQGKDCIIEVPKDRWDWKKHYSNDRTEPNRHYSKWGGFITGVDEFDPRFFNISPREAKNIDPQERLFLQHSWMAMEDAGYTRERLQITSENDLSGQVGVYAGVMYGEYNLSGSLASIANRVSYVLNLHGPSITLDTMCSSSLTSVHLACQDLKSGRTDMALAGGVNVSIDSNKYQMLSTGQFISSDGHCQSFGEGGDGYIPGEGVGVVVLKRLSDAEKDGDHIYGIIKGSALNHGGKTNGYSVPNPRAQASVISRALREANIHPRHISYIEAHGTGTKLGDPIEITALNKAFGIDNEQHFCQLGSAKSNIGHCESAAGIAGITKVLLQLQHKQIVPSLHSEKLNPHIDFEHTPFVVNQSLKTWENPIVDGQIIPRIAGVSSFGAGGANAHILIEEYNPIKEKFATHTLNTEVAIVLSARTQSQLQEKIQELVQFLQNKENKLDLLAIAFTLQTGREAIDERFAITVVSVQELVEKLSTYLNNTLAATAYLQAKVKDHKNEVLDFKSNVNYKETLSTWTKNGDYTQLLTWWTKGIDVPWNEVYTSKQPQRISLPTYPFAKESYRLTPEERGRVAQETTKATLHPFVHENTSNISETRFSTTFGGDEPYVKDFSIHKENQKFYGLPFSASIEMAREAIAQAIPNTTENTIVAITDVKFGAFIRHTEEIPIHIAILPENDMAIAYEIYSQHEEEHIHVQGKATYIDKKSTIQLDTNALRQQMTKTVIAGASLFVNTTIEHGAIYQSIKTLYLGNNQALAHLQLPSEAVRDLKNYTVHPSILESTVQAVAGIIGDQNQQGTTTIIPTAIHTINIYGSCTSEMYAWIRYSETATQLDNEITLDIDICDADGIVCVKCIGISFSTSVESTQSEPIARTAAAVQEITPVEMEETPQEIFFSTLVESSRLATETDIEGRTPNSLEKPSTIKLATPEAIVFDKKLAAGLKKGRVQLTRDNSVQTIRTTTPKIRIFNTGKGIYKLQLEASKLDSMLISQLKSALQKLTNEEHLKVLHIVGTHTDFLHGDNESFNEALDQKLLEALISFPYPIIANMEGNASNVVFLLGCLCDFMICNETATYSLSQTNNELTQLFNERFGDVLAAAILEPNKRFTGTQLKEVGFTMPIVDSKEVTATAEKLGENLAEKSQLSLGLLKQHLSRHLAEKVRSLTAIVTEETIAFETIPVSNTKYINIKYTNDQVCELTIKETKLKGIQVLVKEIDTLIASVNTTKNHLPLILKSEQASFIPETAKDTDVLKLSESLFNCKYPIIAVFNQSPSAKAWFIGLHTDKVIYKESSNYTAKGLLANKVLASQAKLMFTARYGALASKEILLLDKTFSGSELQSLIPTLRTTEENELATTWAQEINSVKAWKAAVNNIITEKQSQVSSWKVASIEEEKTPEEGAVALQSSVIKAVAHKNGVLEVRLEERSAKNMFTDAFMAGVNEVFEHIENNAYKVIILTGYDNYFASGGTKEGLVAIQEGKSKFTDTKIFQLAMECKVPVIAAMQGHAIGAGWAMGMYADFTIFSKERKYRSPYMNYGFTPGAGATYIFPEVVGYDLARETLFTANEYSGLDFQHKGLLLPVLSKDKVVSHAMELAKMIAQNSRNTLIAFKRQLTQNRIAEAEATKKLEVAMHEETFVGDAVTLQQIQENFTHKQTITTSDKVKNIENEAIIVSEENSISDIVATIKKFLANELHLHENEIEEDAQFVDIGLDSITGVTWIRKINEYYKLSLEATQIYTYTTLQQLGNFIQEELGTVVNATKEIKSIAVAAPTIETTVYEEEIVEAVDEVSDIVVTIKKFLASELHLEENEIDETAQFVDIGLDSITGVTWIRKINDHYKTSIEATQIYTYPSLNSLGEFIQEELQRLGLAKNTKVQVKKVITQPANTVQQKVSNAVHHIQFEERKLVSIRTQNSIKKHTSKPNNYASQPIAVVGMAGQFPKAENILEFWENIAQGENCITEVPKERWDINEYYREGTPSSGKTNSKWLGSLPGYDQFDPLFFTISPIEAESMDPQQRLFLQSCWHSIEDAGYNPQALSGTKCGVFVGCATGDYQLPSREQQLSAQGFTGGTSSILAARISYFLNLQGPCIALDTACSSSLVAIANACDSLASGASDAALAGGVYVMTGPEMHVKTAQSGMLSIDGKCHTFDQEANGFVPGEAVGVVMLKRLEDAERDQDNIYGIIKGWGVNQDGRTNGITAPNAASQTNLEQEVYDRYEINPEEIQLIEAHGTGTKLGDPIEVAALKKSFKKYTEKEQYCALGSVKSNIGHCLTAAGVAGFIKVMKAMEHKKLPPTIHYNQLNEHISLQQSPFYVNDRLQDWEVGVFETRHAAISAFGFSGTNAHLVMSEYITETIDNAQINVITQHKKYLIPISARNEEQLEIQVENLLEYVKENVAMMDLVEMAYTLQFGREAMEARLGFMVTSVEELIEKLTAYLQGEELIKDYYKGHIKENKEGLKLVSGDQEMKQLIVEKWVADKKLNKLLDLWTKGLDFDWSILYGNRKPKRLRLPSYPFAKERYWLEPTTISYTAAVQEEARAKLHPLLHKNTANLAAQGFKDATQKEDASTEIKRKKIKRINLPTYPFDLEKCWPEPAQKKVETSTESTLVFKDIGAIEDVIERIDGELLDTDEAVLLLKDLL
ncbi:SDR family NAD(P)-dependent oxidoreductase [Kordia sp.]|uniref:SDR family NAD(P)-dependent oxidoreductase n=1 Tax=Kordia sp. TaxID=1965332 RepID=UPI0025C3F892|nr:SDR family NAD(P)-dependent oxidoreductase [Kordia sp.]MCH2193533.1 SDR family NAD(P)-dependent oxidoreductase [Kordia sp.]